MSKKKSSLEKKFPESKVIKYVTTTPACPMTPRERWIYSLLLWLFGQQPVSALNLSRVSGVDRCTTLPKALGRLLEFGLVIKDGKKYRAVEPTSDKRDWFVFGAFDGEELISYNYCVYDSEYDFVDGLVLASDSTGRCSAALLAGRFGVHPQTITAARQRNGQRFSKQENEPKTRNEEPMTEIKINSLPGPQSPQTGPADWTTKLFDQLKIEAGRDDLLKLFRLLNGLSTKELGEIASALVAKYGTGEGLEDAAYMLFTSKRKTYFTGASKKQVLADIDLDIAVDEGE